MRKFFLSALAAVSLSGCTPTKITGLSGLGYTASAAVTAPSSGVVRTSAVITNGTAGPMTLVYTCPVHSLFRTGSATGTVVYDSRPEPCTQAQTSTTVAAGQSVTLIGDSTPGLASGTYFVTALITINGTTTIIGAGTVTL